MTPPPIITMNYWSPIKQQTFIKMWKKKMGDALEEKKIQDTDISR